MSSNPTTNSPARLTRDHLAPVVLRAVTLLAIIASALALPSGGGTAFASTLRAPQACYRLGDRLECRPVQLFIPLGTPTITEIVSPGATGPFSPGTAVVFLGTNFGVQTAQSYVSISENGTTWGAPGTGALDVIYWSGSVIEIALPSGLSNGTASLSVTNAAKFTSSAISLSITGVTPPPNYGQEISQCVSFTNYGVSILGNFIPYYTAIVLSEQCTQDLEAWGATVANGAASTTIQSAVALAITQGGGPVLGPIVAAVLKGCWAEFFPAVKAMDKNGRGVSINFTLFDIGSAGIPLVALGEAATVLALESNGTQAGSWEYTPVWITPN